ncbi:3,4-dehydroadipyl-CoA semialdehyde dehydrogenase [Serratia liquefaciens]|nr:3,4-dehydroadipyl-CoA semialdehyde dehydrogenase [Serratia liquefaciens]
MQQLASYLSGAWQTGRGRARTIHHAITGAALWEVTSEGLDMAQARRFAIERGGKALQAMTFIERSAMLKAWRNTCWSRKTSSTPSPRKRRHSRRQLGGY